MPVDVRRDLAYQGSNNREYLATRYATTLSRHTSIPPLLSRSGLPRLLEEELIVAYLMNDTGSAAISVLSALHLGLLALLGWILVSNALVGLQLVEYVFHPSSTATRRPTHCTSSQTAY